MLCLLQRDIINRPGSSNIPTGTVLKGSSGQIQVVVTTNNLVSVHWTREKVDHVENIRAMSRHDMQLNAAKIKTKEKNHSKFRDKLDSIINNSVVRQTYPVAPSQPSAVRNHEALSPCIDYQGSSLCSTSFTKKTPVFEAMTPSYRSVLPLSWQYISPG